MGLMDAHPTVFAVGHDYQILVPVSGECTMWVEVGGRSYYDHSNGILRSGRFLHKAIVPQGALDKAKSYRVNLRRIIERKPYFTEAGEVESFDYGFRPVEQKESYRIINLADAHSLVKAPIEAGSHFGDGLDLLVLNGDVPDHSGDMELIRSIYAISGGITKGEVPAVFSRGNHDMRGTAAEHLADYSPTDGGKSYYTFTAGPIWGIVLDTGEDKDDECAEYGHTVCCKAFREEEEEFLKETISKGEFKDYPVRIIISHNPFVYRGNSALDMEMERFKRWCALLREVKASVWLTGHLHKCFLEQPGGPHDTYGSPAPLLCSSALSRDEGAFLHAAGALTVSMDGALHAEFPIVQSQTR